MRGETHQALHVARIGDLLDQLARLVDHRHVGVLARQIARDIEADLAGAADDDFHGLQGSAKPHSGYSGTLRVADAERAPLAMPGRALPSDAAGGEREFCAALPNLGYTRVVLDPTTRPHPP